MSKMTWVIGFVLLIVLGFVASDQLANMYESRNAHGGPFLDWFFNKIKN